VIIIGAGRSGTNMLRDMLTSLPDFATWDCDEINPIWRHGNIGWPNDEIPPENATTKVDDYIRRAFTSIWKAKKQPGYVVEKTCANSVLKSRIAVLLGKKRRLAIWGPRFEGMDQLGDEELEIICTRQWIECVTKSDEAFAAMPDEKYLKIRYEDITADPAAELSRIIGFLGSNAEKNMIEQAVGHVSSKSVGKGHRDLGPRVDQIKEMLAPVLRRHKYKV